MGEPKTAVVIGGTRFVGRHTVAELLDHGYQVTTITRGHHPDPFAVTPTVESLHGNRNDRATLEQARTRTDPDVVIDCIGLVPQQIAMAIDVFADVEAYVFVSSIAAYARPDLPRREETTPLEPFSADHAVDDPRDVTPGDFTAYGPRKAECDRVCFAAADDGVNAMVVRPTFVFGPHDYTQRFDYWIDRIATHDTILLPGDGDGIVHHVYVEDVATAIRTVAEYGIPGEAYNVAARQALTWAQRLEYIADALQTSVRIVDATPRDLASASLDVRDFPLQRSIPVLVSTENLATLDWETTPHQTAIAATVTDHLAADRTCRHLGPDRAETQPIIDARIPT